METVILNRPVTESQENRTHIHSVRYQNQLHDTSILISATDLHIKWKLFYTY